MDSLVKCALISAICNWHFIDSFSLFEEIILECVGCKWVGSTRDIISRWLGLWTTGDFYYQKWVIEWENFDLIYWGNMGCMMKKFLQMYEVWVSKHIIEVCGCHAHLSCYNKSVKNICPTCRSPNEMAYHVVLCKDSGRMKLLQASIDDLHKWLTQNNTNLEFTSIIDS